MKILYPIPLNQRSTISTVFREVGSRIDHDVYGFYGDRGMEMDVPVNRIPVPHNIPLRPRPVLRKLYRFARPYFRDFDVIHTPPSMSGLFAFFRKPSPGGPTLVHTYHNSAEVFPETERRLKAKRALMAKYFDEVTAVSPFVANTIANAYGREPRVIPNGVDLQTYRPDRSETQADLYLFVGRMVDQKHPELVLDLAEACPEREFVLCGAGPRADEIRRRTSELPNCRYEGFVGADRLAELYAAASAMLCPFEQEGCSLAILETLASGTPIVGLRDGTIPFLVEDGRSGVLVDELSVDLWAPSIAEVDHIDPDEVREEAAAYDWDVVANQYQELYERARR